jgi:hypothetical protein
MAEPLHDPSTCLANDWCMHQEIFKCFRRNTAFTKNIRVPRPIAFIHQHDRRWLGQHGLAANIPVDQSELQDLLVSERIPPAPVALWEALIDTYCAEPSKVKSQHRLEDYACLIRLDLMKRSPVRIGHLQDRSLGPGNFFRLSNFKMYFGHMINLELHVHFMAVTMHWEAKTDEAECQVNV